MRFFVTPKLTKKQKKDLEKPRTEVLDFGGGHIKKYTVTADEVKDELEKPHIIDWIKVQNSCMEPSRSGIEKLAPNSFRLIVNDAVVFSTNIHTVLGRKLYLFGASFSPIIVTGRDTFCAEIELGSKISSPFMLTCWLGYHYYQDVEIKKKSAKSGKG